MSVDILEPSRAFPRLLAGNRAPAALPDKPVWGRGRAPFPGPHGPVGSDNRNPTSYKPFWALSRLSGELCQGEIEMSLPLFRLRSERDSLGLSHGRTSSGCGSTNPRRH